MDERRGEPPPRHVIAMPAVSRSPPAKPKGRTAMDRPYFHHHLHQLEVEFEKHQTDLAILRAVRAELEHRRTPMALQLRARVDARLKILTTTVGEAAQASSAPRAEPTPGRSSVGGPMRFFGIDLGTSKCCVAYAVSGARPNVVPQPTVIEFRVDPVLGSKSPVVPSVVSRSAETASGPAATLFAFESGQRLDRGQVRGRNGQEVFRSVKSHLGTGRSYVHADSSLNTPVKVWAALIRHLCEMVVAEKGADFDPRQQPTALTVPASFSQAQRDDTLAAARLAGFNVDRQANLVHLIDEPVAALIDALNAPDIDLHVKPEAWNTVLVFDFGGGTCDLTLLKFRYDASKPTGIDIRPQAISPYQQIGGDTIDLAIMHKVLWPQVCHLNRLERQLTARERQIVEDRLCPTACRRLKEHLNEKLRPLPPEAFAQDAWDGMAVEWPLEQARCFLGSTQLGGIVTLTADALHEVMAPFIDPCPDASPFRVGESHECVCFARLVEITMERAGLTPDKLDLLVLQGGSCKSRFVRRAFEQMQATGFLARTCKIIETPDLSTSVARGAALSGCLSKKYGRPYIQPIVPEDMPIETAGPSIEALVYAGDGLPCKKSFDKFFLSSPGQREIVVPIYIGHEAERRRLASTLTIPLEAKNLPQSHPVTLELEIDTDKISRWRFRPQGCDWSDAHVVQNPWIGREPTDNVKKLQETREEIRAAIDANQRPPIWLLATEALQAARAGYPEEGLALIEDIIALYPQHSHAWNIKALIHAQQGEERQSLECYTEACAREPENMLLRGNLGTGLVSMKRYQEAVAVMREALAKDPSLTYLHSWLADAFQALGDLEEMNKELEKRLAHARRQTTQRPEDVSAWRELREAAMRLGRYEEADQASEEMRALTRRQNLLAGARHG
jgi:molecular chaperone DnaK (HSP70)/Tfp pilus assembly protein PilF